VLKFDCIELRDALNFATFAHLTTVVADD